MAHYKTLLDTNDPEIVITGDALGKDVYPTLKMARAALVHEIDQRIASLRAAKHAAIRTAEKDLRNEGSWKTPAPQAAA